MYKFIVTWYVHGVKIETEVFFDDEVLADMALDQLDLKIVEIIGDTKPVVLGP